MLADTQTLAVLSFAVEIENGTIALEKSWQFLN
jgi:hypothetical protein